MSRPIAAPLAAGTVAFQLHEGEAYYQALLKSLPHAKERIVIASMIVLSGDRTAKLFEHIEAALARGVRVHILLDNYTRLPQRYGMKGPTGSSRVRNTFALLEKLQAGGANIYYYGRVRLQPYKGRCHVKITVVDDTSYSFGGINFYDEMLGFSDYLLAAKNRALADYLEQLVVHIGTTKPPLPGSEQTVTPGNTILFDGGQPKRSPIYDHACELTAHASRVFYVSQMAPSGELAKLLRQTNATLYYNRPEQMQAPDRYGQAFDQKRYHLPNEYTDSNYIHAKYMLFEQADGRRISLSGSNNFSYRGVAFGTQEIALQSDDSALWDQLHTYMETSILS